MTARAVLRALALLAGAGLVLAGLAGVKWYVWDVAIGGIGEPDRSMLFWGLPILWMALGALAGGAWLAWLGRPRREGPVPGPDRS